MFKSLDIEYFQAHKKTSLEFVPGVNVIIGQSDSGKSSTLRSLNLVVNNKPSGAEFCSWFAEKNPTKVAITTAEDSKVTRVRSASVNQYLIDDEVFKAFGAGEPPAEVTDVLKMGSINIAKQLDAPFLLSASPGEVARYMNQIAGIDKIDLALSNIASTISGIRSNSKTEESEIEKLQESLKQFARLDEFEESVAEVEHLFAVIAPLEVECQQLANLVSSIKKVQAEATETADWLRVEVRYAEVQSLVDELKVVEKEHRELQQIVSAIKQLDVKLKDCAELVSVESAVSECLLLADEYSKQAAEVKQLKDLIESIRNINQRQGELATAIAAKEAELPESCPICGGAM